MTVRQGSGDAVGDAGGDLATPAPAAVRLRLTDGKAPEHPLEGRFWVLAPSDDEDEDEDAMDVVSPLPDAGSLRYLCRTPEEVGDRDLNDSIQDMARRSIKRLHRRQMQRKAAMEFMAMEGTLSSPMSTPLGRSGSKKSVNLPVLEPSVFDDDGQEGWTVVHRQRWSPEFGKKAPDPVIDPSFAGRSKLHGMGSINLRPCPVSVRYGPARTLHRRPVSGVSDRSVEIDRPIRVKVGGAVAGYAFRRLLGFAWRKIDRGEKVVQQPTSNALMNGDGGQGGFNPGRGGFNHGRGGHQPRGGRAGNATRGRMGQGAGRGGQGFNGGRGYQGTGQSGFGRNYVQGESSGTAGGGNYSNSRDENWGGGGQRNYNNNFYSNNRAGYGNNQQRWASQNNGGRGGAFQPRFRGNGDGAPARGPIDADLLHQTVQAVVAAVTAAQKVPDVSNVPASNGAAGAHGQPIPVVTPNAVLQQSNKVVEPHVVQGNAKENEGAGPAKKKKEDKEACFRCKKPGHFIDDCTSPYCDICESVHHVSSACHLLQAPKPTAILHGYANEALMFFEMPCGAFKSKVENPKLAKVSVEGEVMTIPKIIEHMKRIVPYEKFHWEVFHYKDNIYRVKLPSKQEVQRLKNFGSYVCPQKDTILFFDLWSSVEEPLYMLPEVWVRVDGVPSDMRSDYLSLWGIGSLFGKTLDVDMSFTRKNKLLRIKIGCLDRNLVPADSDVFIRRGFYKLRFEVETGHIAQEVNMVEANNDKDGGGDPNNGLGDFDGHNDMEMDARGAEDEATSNKDGQDGNVAKNGVEGMQEHNEQVEEINIGTLKVPLSPIGNAYFDSILAEKNIAAKPILHDQNLSLNNKNRTDFHADSESVRFSSGLPRGRAPVAFSAGLSADSRQHSSRSCGAQPSGRPGELAVAAATNAASPAVQEQRCAAARAGAGPRTANGEQGTEPVGCVGDKRRSGTATQVGSSVAMQTESRTLVSSTLPQKILPTADTANPAVRGV
ncbi:hypothetical protein ACQ4PT_058412 [Festuca glaucescens]